MPSYKNLEDLGRLPGFIQVSVQLTSGSLHELDDSRCSGQKIG
jgi:hypothetical protein